MMLVTLLACKPDGEWPVDDTGPAPPFVETLEPDATHFVVSSSPVPGDPGHPLAEFAQDLSLRWFHDPEGDDGVAGATRFVNGDTVYVRSPLPPGFGSTVERVDAAGGLLWSNADILDGLSFAHGLVYHPDGYYIAVDTSGFRIVAFEEDGTNLWTASLTDTDGAWLPNGIDLRVDEDVVRIAVSSLSVSGAQNADRVAVYRLGSRDELPELEWQFEGEPGEAERLWPHGPQFLTSDRVLVNLAARGQIAIVEGGELAPGYPARPGVLAYPRDTLVLDDGTWLVADAATELLRIYDPFGRFEVVAAVAVPGVFGIDRLDCAAGGGLPCLGTSAP